MMSEQQEREAQRRDAEATLRRERDRQVLLLQLQAGTHREEVELLAHCSNVLACDDRQEPVAGVRITTNKTYADSDPSCAGEPLGRMIENSWTDLDFLHDEDRTCGRCGGPRHLSDSVREIYAPLSGHDQRGLVEIAKKLIAKGVTPSTQAIFQESKPPEGARVAALEKELAELKALIGNGHAAEGPANPPAAVTAPRSGVKGFRKRGERYEALIYKSESGDGRQHAVGSFATAAEAIAAREAALS